MKDPEFQVIHHWAPWPPYDCAGRPLHNTGKMRFIGSEVIDRANHVWVLGKAIEDHDTPLEEPPPGFQERTLLELANEIVKSRN